MVIALVGMLIMVLEGLETGNFLGNLMALVSAVGFAIFSVSLRWRKETPKFTTVALAGLIFHVLGEDVVGHPMVGDLIPGGFR